MKRRRAGLVFAFLFVAGEAMPQAASSELARQHLESGIQFYRQGRYKQALNDFQIIVSSMADSDYADDALLHIGEYYLEVEEDFARARETFESILQRYPTQNAAPGAYYYLGEVALRAGRGAEGVDDAMANFQRVFLYPANPWIPAALYGTGTALERKKQWQEAVDVFYRIVAEHPSSRWAAEAQLAIGRDMARLGKPIEAMIELQRVRNRYPEAPEAERALDLLTLLFRFYGYPAIGRPVAFRPDPSFRVALADKFKDVVAVRLSPKGIEVLEAGRDRLVTFDPTGKLSGTTPVKDPTHLSVDPRGAVVVGLKKGLAIDGTRLVLAVPDEKGPKQLEEIRAAVRDRLGDLYVYDDKQKLLLRFDPNGKPLGPFPDSSRREVLRLDMDPTGNLVVLDKKEREIEVFGPAGSPVARIGRRGAGWELKKPGDIAVDPAGFLYVLDEDRVQIAVFDPSYRFVTLLDENRLGGGVLGKPQSLDVDAAGDLYIYDDKEKAVVRLH